MLNDSGVRTESSDSRIRIEVNDNNVRIEDKVTTK